MDPSDLLASQPGLSGKPHGQRETLSQNKGVWQLRDDTKRRCLHTGPQVTRPSQSLSFSTSWLGTPRISFLWCLFSRSSTVKGEEELGQVYR